MLVGKLPMSPVHLSPKGPLRIPGRRPSASPSSLAYVSPDHSLPGRAGREQAHSVQRAAAFSRLLFCSRARPLHICSFYSFFFSCSSSDGCLHFVWTLCASVYVPHYSVAHTRPAPSGQQNNRTPGGRGVGVAATITSSLNNSTHKHVKPHRAFAGFPVGLWSCPRMKIEDVYFCSLPVARCAVRV